MLVSDPMMVMAILFPTIGREKGLELICTGKHIDAWEAEKIGMINQVVPHERLREKLYYLPQREVATESSF
jgi:enoyl-CoA hydratase/carnithine racemase